MKDLFPFVTIGITCYNAADTIARAIKSAQNQNWKNFEIVIVDDFSTDSSVEIIQKTIHEDDRCCLFKHDKNKGVAAARNMLLEKARGEFIVFFDDDDESHPDRIRIQYNRLTSYESEVNQRDVACYASVKRQYSNGYAPVFQAIGSQKEEPTGQDLVAYQLYLDRRPEVFYGNGTPCLSFMARTDVVRKIGGFDENLRRNEDGEFSIRLGLAGGSAIGCPEVLVFQNASAGIDKRPAISLESDLYIIQKYRSFLEEKNKYFYARMWAQVKYNHYARRPFFSFLYLFLLTIRHPYLSIKRFLERAPARLFHEWKISRVMQKKTG